MHLQRQSTISSAVLLLALAATTAMAQSINSIPSGSGTGSSSGSAPIGQVRTDTRPLLAVLPFEGKKVDADQVAILADALASDLMRSGKVRVMERAQMDRILKEQGLQQSGLCDGGECAVEMGRLLGIDQMVVGSIGQLGRTYIITARLVSVATGEVIRSASRSQQGEIDRMLTDLVPRIAQDLVGEAAPAKTVAAAPAPASRPKASTPAPRKDEPTAEPGFRRFRWGVDGSLLATGIALGDSFNYARNGMTTKAQGGWGYRVNFVADWLFNPSFGLRSSLGFASRGWSWTGEGESYDESVGNYSLENVVEYRVSYLDLALGLQGRFGRRFALAGGYQLSRPLDGQRTEKQTISALGESVFDKYRHDVQPVSGSATLEDLKENAYLFNSHSLFLESEFLANENLSFLLGLRISTSLLLSETPASVDSSETFTLERSPIDDNIWTSDLSLGLRYRF